MITGLFGGILGLFYVLLSLRVIYLRYTERISLGYGDSNTLGRAMRGHGNFSEYVPITLVMMLILEQSGASESWLYAIGTSLLLGRLSHAYAFFLEKSFPARGAGMVLTFAALITACVMGIRLGMTP